MISKRKVNKVTRFLVVMGAALCLMVGLLLPTLPVSANDVVVSVDAPATVAPGGYFTAQVDISTVTDFDAALFEVVFDSSVLEIEDITPGADITNGLIGGTTIPIDGTNEISAGRVRILPNVPSAPGVTGEGYLCQIRFHAIGAAGTSSTINLENGSLSDKNGDAITATWTGATVDVEIVTEPPDEVWVNDDWGSQADVDLYNPNLVWQYDAFATIQDGIDNVDSSTVWVLEGEYDGFKVEETEDLSIIGEEGAVVTGAINAIIEGEEFWVMALVMNSQNIDIEGLDFDGGGITGKEVLEGIAYGGSTGSITDVTVSDVAGNEMGMGIAVWGGEIDTVNISDTTVEGCQIGVMVGADQVNLENCTITGPAGGEVFSIGIIATYGAIVNIESCEISAWQMDEPEPGQAGFGVYVMAEMAAMAPETAALAQQFAAVVGDGVTTVEITECSTITGNNFGITVVDSILVANGNNIAGNDVFGIYNESAVEVDARENWWGDASGPGGVGPGTGDAVSDNVAYVPWLDAPCPEGEPVLPTAVSIQVAFLLDSSGSIGSGNWEIMVNGLADAVENSLCIPQNGSVELTVVRFASSASTEVGPVVITSANAATVAANIRAIPYTGGMTCIACAFHVAADALADSPNFSPSLKQAINLVTDGDPTQCDDAFPCDSYDENAIYGRNYAIDELDMTEQQDIICAEAIGGGADVDWLRDEIVFPQPGCEWPIDEPSPACSGWVRQVSDAQEFAATICEKLAIIIIAPPTCDFTATPRTGTAPLRVQFTGLSTGDIDTRAWDFDNDGVIDSTQQNHSYTYTIAGRYTVSLTVTGPGGSCTETKVAYIIVQEFPMEEEGPPNLVPAYLLVSPEQVGANQEVEISINVGNDGGTAGTRSIALYINGNLEDSQTVSVSPGSAKNVVFTVTRTEPGTYQVLLEGNEGQFTVLGTADGHWAGPLGTGGIIAIVVFVIALVLGLVFVLRRE